MSEAREAVIEEVIQRLVEERGIEILALDWAILDRVVNEENNLVKHPNLITPDKSRNE